MKKNAAKEEKLSHEQLKSLVSYDPESGGFVWLVNRPRGVKAGDKAGNKRNDGYIQLSLNGTVYMAHRVAWFYVHGAWPESCIDHINRNKADNSIANLRKATHRQNSQNRGVKKTNPHGLKGIAWHKRDKAWQAVITIDGKKVFIGYFADKQDAANAYKAMAVQHHSHHNF